MFGKRIAVGIAAAAIAITALASSAPQAEATLMFTPDVHVYYQSRKMTNDGDDYTFRIRNEGTVTANSTLLLITCYYWNADGSFRTNGSFGGAYSIPEHQQVTRTISCPTDGAHSVKARLQAFAPDDTNQSNNSATSPALH